MKVERIKEIADGLLLHADAGLIAFADAIRSEALEEAAKVCDEMVSVSAVSYETGSACAAAIRALSQKTAQGETNV